MTGSSADRTMSTSLPQLCARVREAAQGIPIAVGFGVNTRDHFLNVGSMADGVVIGSKIVSLIKTSPQGSAAEAIRDYCREVSGARHQAESRNSHEIGRAESTDLANLNTVSMPTETLSADDDKNVPADEPSLPPRNVSLQSKSLHEVNPYLNLY